MIVTEGDREIAHTLWADTPTDERNIFEKFLAVVDRYENPTIYCYGEYERAFIRRMRAKVRRKKLLDKVIGSLVNVLSLIYAHFYFPVYSNGLKEIGRYLGCIWTEPDASAAQSIAWRIWWARTRDNGWKAKLIAYNLEDCTALRKVVDVLQKVSADTVTSLDSAKPEGNVLPVSRVGELEKLANPRKWGANHFVDPDYRFVNDRSYFDFSGSEFLFGPARGLKSRSENGARSKTVTFGVDMSR